MKEIERKIMEQKQILKVLDSVLCTTPSMQIKVLVMQDMQAKGYILQELLEQANERSTKQ